MKVKIKDERNAQMQFEQFIELLIQYKKCHLDKDVYLNMESLDEAIKWYHSIANNIDPEMIKQLKKGQIIFNKQAKINAISHLDGKSKNEIGIELHSLSPAALVKLFDSIGLKVIQMDRVTFGGLTKKDLPRGNWRKLSIKEIGFLKMLP